MSTDGRFQSFLGPEIEQFLAHKRSLRRRYFTEEKTLALLDAFLSKNKIDDLAEITPALVDEFLLSRPRSRPRSYNHLRCTVGRLFSYLVDHEKLAQTPLRSPPRRGRYQRAPFIFDAKTASRLLALAKDLPSNGGTIDRGNTYFVLFAVLYGLGLRVGEVCRLCLKDIDLERRLLVIRETKFYKNRLVAFGPKLGALLTQHLRQRLVATRAAATADDQPLFCLRGGRPINPGTVSQTFHTMVPSLNLQIPPGISPPCVHNLRHSFAVGALTRWYRLGIDPQTKLLALSTFMGHSDISSTAVYLTTTPELLEHANRRFRTFAAVTLGEELA
ncbi:tyrosine-type recombinase/integrase [Bradyrhizobium sp. CCGUVB14]|uniref:tyrosine-type recombinase/integrase n=1 Tax=Bradyrhizobium sp. CCGUVB14 TaxID=2949628 RepID=UPI0020B2BB42|nr:tyrosine-type recombinase/integrase [Bradyrhizobium sp. CCGUVB14]MCP3441161.1 tyrosine-type recombinase/integrase [Bradyrhizobium sp. CCGUVB14]MCP3441238.1 tyrosine-type recombinase/integrase [Bradyrhizobium sp. CCGUVB14]